MLGSNQQLISQVENGRTDMLWQKTVAAAILGVSLDHLAGLPGLPGSAPTPTDTDPTLGGRIRQDRTNRGITLQQLAEAMGDRYDHSVLSRVENGISSLRPDGLRRAALALGVSADHLLGLAG